MFLMLESKTSRIVSNILAIIVLLVFIALALLLVRSKGVCCADDAYLSTVAKNLAHGLGYVSTMQAFAHHYTIRPFDPTDGTGPTIILLAALFIKIFGNAYWAPGLANITFWSLLLVLVGYLVRQYNYGVRFSLFTALFLYLDYVLMTYHYEHWYALLGEVPSALLLILGILCFFHRDTKSYQFLTGVLFLLAVESKLLSLVPCFGFLIGYGFIYLRTPLKDWRSTLKKFLGQVFFIGLGFLFPLSFFELWKFIVLGLSGYLLNWRKYLGFIHDTGAQLNRSPSLAMLYNARAAIVTDNFGILLPIIAGMLILGWMLIKKDTGLKRLHTTFLIIVAIYSTYWFFLSNGRARYYIICLIILNFLMTLPLLSSRPNKFIMIYCILLVAITSNTWGRLQIPFSGVDGQFIKPSAKTQALIEISNIVSQKHRQSDSPPIVTQWWATAADIEYLMDTSHNFTTLHDPSLLNGRRFTLVVNTLFLDKNDEKNFDALIASCKDVRKINVYLLATCKYNNPK